MKRPEAMAGLALAVLLLLALPASAERAWVRGAPLMLRSGPGTQFRILGSVEAGEAIEISQRNDGWTQVRTADGKEGWVAAGYLDPVAPPAERLGELEGEVERLSAELDTTGARARALEDENAQLSGDDADRRAELDRLARENAKLRAGERWAEWITGALILGTGMAFGAILSRLSGRRSRNRLRL